ncbi:MAG TPA: ergothioneine biosynthesis protein EgtB [Gemmatimonadales bacterium]
MTTGITPASDTAALAALLSDARERTLLLLSTVEEDALRRQHDPLMGPILWDLGHIAAFEELWLLRNTRGRVTFGEMPGLFDPFEHPRRTRGELTLPPLAETLADMDGVRRRVLELLPRLDPASPDPLLHDGYVVRMVAQHEHQHGETILQALQLVRGAPYSPPVRREHPAPSAPVERGMVRVAGGLCTVGTGDRSRAYDNERPRHEVELPAFWIDRTPVTNGDYREFMEAGGYRERAHWTDAGWAWLRQERVEAPRHWRRVGGEWHARTMDREGPVPADHPVCHVSCHEAEAYARWAGGRLPTEHEWEVAATWDPAAGRARRFPWGDEDATPELANIDQLGFGTAPVGSHPRNVSPLGCHGMIGDVWEWTASDFRPYPGYETFPYPEYSEVFFGDEYRVLRGGSWATRPLVARPTFRNWDYPVRRQIFSGFRCARDDA